MKSLHYSIFLTKTVTGKPFLIDISVTRGLSDCSEISKFNRLNPVIKFQSDLESMVHLVWIYFNSAKRRSNYLIIYNKEDEMLHYCIEWNH